MRLFIAINLGEKTKKELLAVLDELRSRALRGSFTFSGNMHLTLAFLGECDKRQADSAMAAMDAVHFEPFELLIERVGQFGGRGAGQDMRASAMPQAESTWWAGVRVSGQLLELHRELNDNLSDAGFILDKRKFSPHITFGRRVVTDAAPWRLEPFGETVRKIDLMKSERLDGKLIYTPIYKVSATLPK